MAESPNHIAKIEWALEKETTLVRPQFVGVDLSIGDGMVSAMTVEHPVV